MTFDDLSPLLMSVQCTYVILLLTALFGVGVASVRMRRGIVSYIINALLIAIAYVLYEIFAVLKRITLGITENKPGYAVFHAAPEWVWIVSLAVMTLFCVLMAVDVLYYGAEKLSSHSVKFATDGLPTGLCIYDNSGRILLMNETMAKIGKELTGQYILSGREILSHIDIENNEPFRLSDGSVYTFGIEKASVGSTELYEITAENITEEYLLTEKLNRVDMELTSQQKRLRDLNVLITELTIQKEILAAKTSIHDRFGSTIIATKRFMRGVSESTAEEITAIWFKCLDILKSAAEPEKKNIYDKVFTVAEYVGVEIKVKGELPSEKDGADIIVTALIESLTNTFRHARGDRILLECKEDSGGRTYILTNNGEPPKAEITESGGLKNLRQAAEAALWNMEIKSFPHFELMLKAPNDRKG